MKLVPLLFVVALWLSIVGYAAHVISENIAQTLDDTANTIARS